VSAIAQLKAMIGLDATAYKAGGKQVAGVNAEMRSSMGRAAGGFSVFKENARDSSYAMTGLHNASAAYAAMLRGDFVMGAQYAAGSLRNLGLAALRSPFLLIGVAAVASIAAVRAAGDALDDYGKRLAELGKRRSAATTRARELELGEPESEADAARARKLQSDAGKGRADLLSAQLGQERESLAEWLRSASSVASKMGKDEYEKERQRRERNLAETKRALDQAIDAERKAKEESAELLAKREGREVEYYRRREREARRVMTAVGQLEADKFADRARAAEEAQTAPRRREIERLQEQQQSVQARARGTTLDRGALARVGGFSGNERAGFEIQTKAMRVAEESRALLADIARLQKELIEVERLNRGER